MGQRSISLLGFIGPYNYLIDTLPTGLYCKYIYSVWSNLTRLYYTCYFNVSTGIDVPVTFDITAYVYNYLKHWLLARGNKTWKLFSLVSIWSSWGNRTLKKGQKEYR